ncbi:cytochrome P450 89A2-like [Senna tora]|uniref:Cytochrome P450 89A2-like n=1 Tax=Senna tora TaxID=362788 RepID=A0A834SY48_9FABA|nr:cytochrome P450 89A2-like [Senna tora]
MELWFILVSTLCLCFLIRAIFFTLIPSHSSTPPLPPGPPPISLLASLFRIRNFFSQEFEHFLRNLHAKHGPIITLPIIPSNPAIFISDPSLAHQALVQNGAVFSNRPDEPPTASIINTNQHSISSAFYGPTWRLLRRNLTSRILHPTRLRSFSGTRKWVLDILIHRLESESESKDSVKIIDHLHHAMFSLLVFMCFGERLDEEQIRSVENVQRNLLVKFIKFNVLNFMPRVTRILFYKRWEELLQIRKEQEEVLIPLIRARKKAKEEHTVQNADHEDEGVVSYVDTLLDLELPEEKRKLHESELVSVASEFLNAGTDTTTTALQWIMANLVKYPHIQQRVFEEIRDVIGNKGGQDNYKEVKEEDLSKLLYLKAVILEGLRRHPPGHFLLPHAVSKDVVLGDYLVPKNGTINFMVAEMGWDPRVWENPMEFKPERFLKSEGEEVFDITGSKEIKMMPFGAGRRICPAYNLAMLHLEYFVANLVWNFEWKAANGDVDLSEKLEFTVVMKNPLQVHLTPRLN